MNIPQYFAMSIGDWESEDFQNPPKGNFQSPITSYDLAEFGPLLDVTIHPRAIDDGLR
ncbi:hypothetical protein ACGRL8_02005 [Vibrio rumoiensis]|uniref:Uncharacterized protein n=1 Tax=Vibrio rumoiensis TaxID=76258 RepID=A0ABW7IS18_9VIBR